MNNMEYIESYFKRNNTEEQKLQFENKIMEEPGFAEEVAFYISANGAIKQELYENKKQSFREIYDSSKVIAMKPHVRTLWKYLAAASVIVLAFLITWLYSASGPSLQQLADQYVQQNFQTLNVTMGTSDTLQTGISLFNSGSRDEALKVFKSLENRDPSNSEAIKYAGIVSLKLRHYDKALEYFSRLEGYQDLYSNPGKFYKAIALLERNRKGDNEQAKQLLREVVNKDLEGRMEAEKWLKKF